MLATIDRLPHVTPEQGDVSASLGVMGKLSIGVEPAVGDALMLQHGHMPDEGAEIEWREISHGSGMSAGDSSVPRTRAEARPPVQQHPATRDLGSFVINR